MIDSYSEAKRVLNASAPDRLVCRSKEVQELEEILENCFEEKKAASIYVNGQPGTGKTLTINHILEGYKTSRKIKQIYVNCMSVKNIQSFYKTILQEMSSGPLTSASNTGTPKRNTKDGLGKLIEQQIMSSKNHIVLVLDEIDQIETTVKAGTDLYKIFEWPFLPNSKLILIGIANSLDFTDRLLPRLELKPENKPKIIKYMPYSKEDIICIIKDRLKDISTENAPTTVIDDRALTYCATKIASASGDIRKALDICRRAVELVEKDAIKASNGATEASNVKAASIAQMMRIFNDVNPMTNSNLDKNSMPLMQKILLCTVLMCTKQLKAREIPLSKLYDKFNKICKAYSTAMDSESEFVNLCTNVQDMGLVEVKRAKDIRTSKISLRIDEEELKDKLQDEAFMADILDNPLYK